MRRCPNPGYPPPKQALTRAQITNHYFFSQACHINIKHRARYILLFFLLSICKILTKCQYLNFHSVSLSYAFSSIIFTIWLSSCFSKKFTTQHSSFTQILVSSRVLLTGQKCFMFNAHKTLCIIYRIRNRGAIIRGLCYR